MSRRWLLTGLTILLGLALVGVGFGLAAPIGGTHSPRISNPRVEFAPLMFVAGVILIFLSAVVYEVTPEGRRR